MSKSLSKEEILRSAHRMPLKTLMNYVAQGDVSLQDIERDSQVSSAGIQEIREDIEKKESAGREEREDWATARTSGTVGALRNFQRKYPGSTRVTEAEQLIEQVKRHLAGQKQRALDEISQERMTIPVSRIREYIDSEILTIKDISDEGIIPEDRLTTMLNPPAFLTENIRGWGEKLPDLRKSSTDVYFFGIPSSGKSSILAGVLAYGTRNNQGIQLTSDNDVGYKYARNLIKSVSVGHVPASSPLDGLNFISFDITTEQKKRDKLETQPVNIIEMSGEFFRETFNNFGKIDSAGIAAQGYLRNENRKLFFLVVDYFRSTEEAKGLSEGRSDEDQEGMLEFVVDKLDRDGTFNKVDGLFIVVTKCDLLTNGVGDKENLLKFIDKEYSSLRQRVSNLKRKYKKMDTAIIPFSLGRFYHSLVYTFDETSSENIVGQIRDSSFLNR